MANSENGTIFDVLAAVDLLAGSTVSLDELCQLMPERSRQAICTSMNSIVRTSGKARGITVVRKANPKTWRIATSSPLPKNVKKDAESGVKKKDVEPEVKKKDAGQEWMHLRIAGRADDGAIIAVGSGGKVYRLTPL